MIPIVLDPKVTPLALVGRGEVACRRLEGLLAGGAYGLQVYSDQPSEELARAAAGRLRRSLPDAGALARLRVLWIADLPLADAAPLAQRARAQGVLVNVEDVIGWCDFHNPSVVRRGDLLLTVSTGGRSPGLAARIRRELAERFGPEWALRLERLGGKRAAWRRRPRPLEELARLTDAMIDRQRWLPRGDAR
jgi:precorrin-2 dehydrogenase/sirohydrochlorin ferrochelatase